MIRSSLLVATLFLAVTAGDTRAQSATDSTNAPSIAGTYVLVAIDGRTLPCAPSHPGMPANAPPPLEVLASTFVVKTDGSFLMAMAYRSVVRGAEQFRATPFTGTWRPEGSALVARWAGAGMTPLTLAGDTLVLNNEGMRFAYRKVR